MKKASRPPRSPKFGVKRHQLGIREIYEDGCRICQGFSKKEDHKSTNARIDALADENQMSAAELWKRVRFTEIYDENDLQELLKLENLAWGHVRKLLTVPSAKQRARFAQMANKQRWGPRRMTCEIEARQGTKNLGGRPTKLRSLTPGTLYELQQEVAQMLRLFAAFRLQKTEGVLMAKAELLQCRRLLPGVVEKLQELNRVLPGFTKNIETAFVTSKSG